MLKALTLLSLIAIVSCGPISMDRRFLNEMGTEEDDGFALFSPGKAFDTVGGDPSYERYTREEMMERTPASEEDYPEWTQDRRLKRELQGKLNSLRPADREEFYRKERYFENDSQKLYYLSLGRYEQKKYDENLYAYRNQRSFRHNRKTSAKSRNLASVFHYSPRAQAHREIEIGMDKKAVIQRWGNPHRVDTAGNPRLGNERWTFYENGDSKYVFFSKGKVDGWTLE
ncbi:hypothetical protein [Halobacteriovorax sp. DPLXC-1]|uniref:hypothetical protein n=1 Tax=unclassified Halobacteriovorax TaxID=2639665 RepID=UPI002FF04E40